MTRSEIETMPPDRLTALLAERVMGWKKCTDGYCDGCDAQILQRHGESTWVVIRDDASTEWDPTTDRNDLAELLSSVNADRVIPVANEIYCALLDTLDGPYWSPAWSALTCDPVAICRAVAVAVLGGET